MPKVFVHGNPETSAIWASLIDALAERHVRPDDMIALSPPGFGAPVVDGWPATQTAYRNWLIDELETIGEPVDLVAHDWGTGHVLGVVAHRPDLVRSWATDCVGLVGPDYVWHDMAQAWQTPEVGEQVIAAMIETPLPERVEMLTGLGIPANAAAEIAPAMNTTMGTCLLKLYRSAIQPAMSELGALLVERPHPKGLAIIAVDDPFVGSLDDSLTIADRLDADTVTLDGLGHWWMFDGAATVADKLVEFWKPA